jgi:hypothetical protein
MRENKAEESTIRSQPRPESVGIYRQDDVNAAINRYADPPLHCELLFAKHPETAIEHAFILSSPYQDVGEGHPASETAASRSRVAAISLARLLNGS